MLDKAYTKTGRSCRVTFELPAEIEAQSAALCGEFNNWDPSAYPMKKRKDGRFSLTISLKPGSDYRFRYFLDGQRWENDPQADAYVANGYGSNDSVVTV
jgi:1,4-alpha-glucan branching enzyme